MASLRAMLSLVLVMTLLLGVVYPVVVTAIAQIVLPHHANGSLVEKEGRVIGSRLLGQTFTAPKYFWSRLSATTPPYNAAASTGSNFAPGNPKLLAEVNERLAALRKADPKNKISVPIDLVTASGSGLDPHISLAAARYQIPRIAAARGMKTDELNALVEAHTVIPGFGLYGLAYVNVLELNLALDELKGTRP